MKYEVNATDKIERTGVATTVGIKAKQPNQMPPAPDPVPVPVVAPAPEPVKKPWYARAWDSVTSGLESAWNWMKEYPVEVITVVAVVVVVGAAIVATGGAAAPLAAVLI